MGHSRIIVGNRLDPESNIRPLIDLLFDPKYWPNIEYFSNSEAGSSYSPKFGAPFVKALFTFKRAAH